MIHKAALYASVENITPPFLFRLFRGSRLYYFVLRQINKRIPKTEVLPVTVTGGDLAGHTIKITPSGDWQKSMIDGTYDAELFDCMRTLELAGKTVYDIGAHICYHSLTFAKYVGTEGHVVAFEPNPANVTRAKEIIALNPTLEKNISVFNIALSDTIGTTHFISSNDIESGTSTGGFIEDASTIWPKEVFIEHTGFTTSEVAIDTIDHMIATKQIPPPACMKIDVEGAEQLVLAGATTTLKTYHPIIIVEFHSMFSAYACTNILAEHAYQTSILKIERDGRVMILAK